MRKILFKAKSIKIGKWIEGYYVYYSESILKDNLHMIVWGKNFQEWEEIDPETLCQYTGLTDKNGNKIFEGDIISIINSNRQGLPAPVHYFYDQCMFAIHRSGYNPIWMSEYDAEHYFEIIGNIYDEEGNHV